MLLFGKTVMDIVRKKEKFFSCLSVCYCLIFISARYSLDDAFAALQPRSERLGAAAAYTAVHAGDKLLSSHCLFLGVNAAVAPNRQLCVRPFTSLGTEKLPLIRELLLKFSKLENQISRKTIKKCTWHKFFFIHEFKIRHVTITNSQRQFENFRHIQLCCNARL